MSSISLQRLLIGQVVCSVGYKGLWLTLLIWDSFGSSPKQDTSHGVDHCSRTSALMQKSPAAVERRLVSLMKVWALAHTGPRPTLPPYPAVTVL